MHVKTTAACPLMTAGMRTSLLRLDHTSSAAVDGGVPVPEDQICSSSAGNVQIFVQVADQSR